MLFTVSTPTGYSSHVHAFLKYGLAAWSLRMVIIISRYYIYTECRCTLTMVSPLTRIQFVSILCYDDGSVFDPMVSLLTRIQFVSILCYDNGFVFDHITEKI